MEGVSDNIELVLPFKAGYVSVARLVASGVGSRIGFDIEAIEDIKVAISEVCNKLVSIGSKVSDCYKIVYSVSEEGLKVTYLCDDPSIKCVFKKESDALAIHIINALMDEVELCTDKHVLSMFKVLERDA
ncbi:ATP-binding protein [Acetivibrio saccincola]|jgi:serine/threonine-protein kinase RsbW|uniref:Anti-sigma regulatory factor n=1 Tax=Acetivibrio saccincola TaxID=1677857 RepID=A0A2K9E5F3_9FIRM|nr:ATP-binding protein [Acetivibrio saccincola]AUG58927.1 Serine-protein kinase RsbW [Acetivibrio saccincola]NLW26947.1 anti-sigma regulatory factor [Acetivibrio saccincola]PQQ65992.1 anti-sigma regulatory factor [Acetivibrio saccincola]HOA98174.1 ATP-binding protein [Acetivibrio saccincola]HQD29895.1 ATP-binding protein [Acetivibrio saccincola]